MRWMVELGRVDIATECSLLSSHLAYPREGHLECALNMMGYLKVKHNSHLFFDLTYPATNFYSFNDGAEWKAFYGNVREPIPDNAPDPRGKPVDLHMSVDIDHTGDKETRRSHMKYFIFLNTALIDWLSKKHSVFGAEFVAMKTGVETIKGIH